MILEALTTSTAVVALAEIGDKTQLLAIVLATRFRKPVPIVLFGSSYWKRLLNLDVLVEEGAISPGDLNLFQYVDTPEQAWEAIEAFYGLGRDPS